MRNKSFTLIEILVVIVIIGILSAFIIVSMSGVSDKARIAKGQAFSNSIKNSLMLNLVSEWRLDDASGTTAQDHWGANPGTWSGAGGGVYTSPSWRTSSECVSGDCLAFDGTDDYVDCGTGNSLDITGAITISVWVYPKINNAFGGIVTKSVDNKFQLVSRNNGYFEIYVENSSSVGKSISNVPITVNAWQHLVAVFNPSEQYLYLYKDVVETSTSCTIGDLKSSSASAFIGKYSGYYFNGLIDDVRIYSVAIPTSQIRQDYCLGLNKLLLNSSINKEEFTQRLSGLSNSLADN
ncbi:MAG: LamG domain-containing protein [Candidatus Pacebacteria bacterium]|nr:LamG domain-containing protein [Candidatus Paceibacterota bacterium]MDD5555240.1 LamG domain-containing protein [Candidatus Paceibacterota bacterium]